MQGAIGSAWGGSAYGNLASGEANRKQVTQQSGLFAEDGGYGINANNVELIAGAIASTNSENSELTTNNLTFRDIENYSSSHAVSAGVSASVNLNKATGTEAKTEAQAKQQAQTAKLTGTPQSNGISPSIPMFDSSEDRSITKATLTEGKITLNKDSNPTQTTAQALGINTDLSQVNREVAGLKDINQTLREQQILSQAAGNMLGAVSTYAEQKAKQAEEEIKQAEAALQAAEKMEDFAKLEEKQNAYAEAKARKESWEDGGANKRRMDAAVMALTSILSGGSAGQVAVAAVSPELNAQIHELTKDSKTANLLAHAALSALEAKASGTSATAGAIAGVAGEATAMLLSEAVFNK
ncbi:hypothetical protein [Bibersteinia trehalosi]|uniref:hypothetical protein n=1 Tax=Bibersteinia trehalosi TaxID=47735 RepID=UPI002D780685|nr:hypothetical protein [Bibersteinia trehalosi]